MAKIAWAIITDRVLSNNKDLTVLENPLPFIELNHLPNNYTFNLCFSVIQLEHDSTHKIKFEIIPIDKNDILSDAEMEFTTAPAAPNGNGKLGIFMQNVEIRNLEFSHYGIYSIVFWVNGEKDHEIYFEVLEGLK